MVVTMTPIAMPMHIPIEYQVSISLSLTRGLPICFSLIDLINQLEISQWKYYN